MATLYTFLKDTEPGQVRVLQIYKPTSNHNQSDWLDFVRDGGIDYLHVKPTTTNRDRVYGFYRKEGCLLFEEGKYQLMHRDINLRAGDSLLIFSPHVFVNKKKSDLFYFEQTIDDIFDSPPKKYNAAYTEFLHRGHIILRPPTEKFSELCHDIVTTIQNEDSDFKDNPSLMAMLYGAWLDEHFPWMQKDIATFELNISWLKKRYTGTSTYKYYYKAASTRVCYHSFEVEPTARIGFY